MKKTHEIACIAVAVAAAFIIPNVNADENAAAGAGPAQHLGLTDDQKTSLKSLRESQRGALETLRSDTSLSDEDKRARAKELRRTGAEQRREVLTPEQRDRVREHRRDRPDRGDRPQRPDRRDRPDRGNRPPRG